MRGSQNRLDGLAGRGMHDKDEEFDAQLCELLVRRGKLDAAGLEQARRLQERSGERVDRLLTKLGLVSEPDMIDALAARFGLPLAQPTDFPEEPVLYGRISVQFLKQALVLPLADRPGGLVLAVADPYDAYSAQAVGMIVEKPVHCWLALPSTIESAIERLYGPGSAPLAQIVDAVDAAEGAGDDDDVERLKDLASEAPVIRLVNLLIARAVDARASDIHIEPLNNALRVRYRIDGVLREVEGPPSRLSAAVLSRVKLMAKLNIAERRLPQDGRIKVAVRGREIDMRVATSPTIHGESVVLRILDRGSVTLDLTALGLADEVLPGYLQVLHRPNGILLVTGPTGSGKTTTLYASLLRLNTPDRKIVTVEDPVEYQLEGVNQIQVKPQIELTFVRVLRSILRQDPDIIMIGEIRDLETAQIAVQAALTGHLVLSTVHTNDAASTVTRMLDMGVEDYLLTSTINGIVAQRLVRTLCPHCKAPAEVLPELVEQMRLEQSAGGRPITLFDNVGCERCNGTGYWGRTSVLEVLPFSAAIRRLVLKRAEAAEIQGAAVAEGMRTMYEDGIRKALAGITTLDEVLRVTRET
jgi:general secretion pathway protein E